MGSSSSYLSDHIDIDRDIADAAAAADADDGTSCPVGDVDGVDLHAWEEKKKKKKRYG